MEEQEYILERILAEKTHDGQTLYLVKWQGYGWKEWSWEPRDSFNDDGTIEAWFHRRQREQAGERRAFDYDDFDRRLKAHWAGEDPETLGEPETEPEEDDQLWSADDDDVEMVQDEPPVADESNRSRSPINRAGISSTTGNGSRTTPKIASLSSSSGALAIRSSSGVINRSSNKQISARATNRSQKTSGASIGSGANGIVKPPSFTQFNLKSARKSSNLLGNQPLTSSVLQRSNDTKNLFDNWNSDRRKRPISALEPSKAPRPFKTLAKLRRAEVSGRSERAPNVELLTLFSPKDGVVVRESTVATPPWGLQQARGPINSPRGKQGSAENGPQSASSEQHAQTTDQAATESVVLQDDLFLTQSPPRDMVASPVEQSMSETRGANDLRLKPSAEQKNNNIEENKEKEAQDIPLTRSTSTPHVTAESPMKRRLFGDATQAKFRRMSVPEEPSELVKVTRGQYSDPLATDFDKITGNAGLNVDSSNPRLSKKGEIYGSLVVGENREIDLTVAFKGLPVFLKPLFLSIKQAPRDVTVWLTEACSPSDYLEQHHDQGKGYFGAGHVDPNYRSKDAAKELSRVFRNSGTGSLFFAEKYTLLLYPTGTAEWSFIDHCFINSSSNEELRFVFRTPTTSAQRTRTVKERTLPLVNHNKNNNNNNSSSSSCCLSHPTTPIEDPHQRAISPDIELYPFVMSVSDDETKKSLKRWIEGMYPPPTKANDPVKFFLFFPTELRAEYKQMEDCLRICCGIKAYGSFEEGEWALFFTHVKRGVVLVHHSITHYHKISHFRKVLRNSNTRIFSVDLSPRDGKTPEEFAQMIFRSGCAVLLPDSLVLSEPSEVLKILQWYRRCIIPTKEPKTWKLILRPQLKEWIKMQITDLASASDRETFFGIFEEYLKVVQASYEDPADPHGTPTAESPLVTPFAINEYVYKPQTESTGLKDLRNNDNLLVKWFGEWSLTQVHRHRRFYVLCNDDPAMVEQTQQWGKDLQHVTMIPIKNFCAMEHVDENLAAYKKRRVGGERKDAGMKSGEGQSVRPSNGES